MSSRGTLTSPEPSGTGESVPDVGSRPVSGFHVLSEYAQEFIDLLGVPGLPSSNPNAARQQDSEGSERSQLVNTVLLVDVGAVSHVDATSLLQLVLDDREVLHILRRTAHDRAACELKLQALTAIGAALDHDSLPASVIYLAMVTFKARIAASTTAKLLMESLKRWQIHSFSNVSETGPLNSALVLRPPLGPRGLCP